MPIAVHKDQEMAAHWKTQIELCDKEMRRFNRRGKNISEKYRADRGSVTGGDQPDGGKRNMALFWSNTEMLKPATYSKIPVPIAERRFLDKDTTGRVASIILERVLRYEVQTCGYDNAVRRARNDRLIPGRGQVWIRYNPKFGDAISPMQVANDEITFDGDQEGKPQDEGAVQEVEAQQRQILSETLAVDYLHWQDYYTFPPKARTEDEIEGKGRRIFMSRQDLEDRFEDGDKVPLDHAPTDDRDSAAQPSSSVNDETNQATVYEIWWKPDRKVYFIAKEWDKCLIPKDIEVDGDGVPDPLHLEGFFPCPCPLNATMTNDTLIPVPDYVEAEDQYLQIDDLTKRIDILTNACKVRGVYDASAQGIRRVFEEGQEPDLIPIDSWAMFAEKGGLKGAMDWVPIEDIAGTLKILIEVRTQIMQDLDHVTGLSDINRGTSDARETMGGVRIKQNNTNGRLQERQDDMARFCREIICIMGEIIAEHYDPQTLIQVSGAMFDEGLDPPALLPQMVNAAPVLPNLPSPPIQPAMPPGPLPPQAQGANPGGASSTAGAQLPQETPEQKEQRKLAMIMQAIDLLRNEKLRGFRIDIETDSTIQGDAQQEKEARIAFVEGVTKFIETAAQVTAGIPEFAPLAAKMLQFAVRGFRVGRDLESAIEDFAEKAEIDAKAKAGQPKQPSPDQIKAQTEMMKAQSEIRRQEIENQGEAANSAADMRMKEIDLEMQKLQVRMAEIKLEETTRQMHGQVVSNLTEGANDTSKEQTVHPHLALSQIAEAAKVFELASKRNAAPREIKRGPDGKATHIVTNFKE